ncbi:MAG: hypothetical protein NZ742_02760 [Acidobacteria bacterium]|nr:hypothetical protein [Acidobacteriota bacterium]MDW7983867.1 hypothetical protein [Acidobacteriota bacterium]
MGERVWIRSARYREGEAARKERSKLPFKEKIRRLVELQKLAVPWVRRKDIIVWKIDKGTPG